MFVISDAQIESLKAASPYRTIEDCEHYYQNSYFYLQIVPVGGELSYKHTFVSYTDQAGVLTTYIDYSERDLNDYVSSQHQFYCAVEYHYIGTSDLRVYYNEDTWLGTIVSNNKALLDSLKIASVKKVDSIPDNATPVKAPTEVPYTIYSYLERMGDSNTYIAVKAYDSEPTVGVYTENSNIFDDCTEFTINSYTVTCECGAVTFTDDSPLSVY